MRPPRAARPPNAGWRRRSCRDASRRSAGFPRERARLPEYASLHWRPMAVTKPVWTPSSWRSKPALHQPEWPSEERTEAARARLAVVPPLVFAGEARQLRAALAEACAGRAFLLQAGECAESFHDLSAVHIREKLKVMLQMAAVLTYGATLPVVKVGRIAGQLAKARSSPTERVGGVEIPSFRGHMVHDDAPTPEARIPDPDRMVQADHN